MSHRFLLFSSLLVLGACAFQADGAIQEVTLYTPGANDSLCYVYVDGFKYKARPPQTMNLSKSKEDLVIDCLAPGNRRKKVVIEPHIVDSFYRNVATGVVPGATWDYLSNAMFEYPSIIEVNFENAVIVPEALPAQNNPDVKQPEEYMLEEFSPGQPRLNSDRYNPPTEIRRRYRPGAASPSTLTHSDMFEDTAAPASISTTPPSGKGNLHDVMKRLETGGATTADDLNVVSDPAPATEPQGAPLPLFPGE